MDKYGISADTLPDAEDMGAEVSINVVPYAEIQKAMDESNHILVY
jgi:hypothetical protein